MMRDKRRANRYNLETLVDVYFSKDGIWDTQAVNLSETGILIKSRQPLGLYAKGTLRLHGLESDRTFIDLAASAVRSELKEGWYFTGLEFTDLDSSEFIRLKTLVPGQ